MKYYITGSTRGLGKYLAGIFSCEAFDRPAYDLTVDFDLVCNNIQDNSVVILNAHANQIEYVKRLHNRCKLVVLGSIATLHPDPNMEKYTQEKIELQNFVESLATHSSILYLRLTSSSYKNYKLVENSIRFWIDNPDITFIGYNVNE